MLPDDYAIRQMRPADYERIGEICRIVYPHEAPFTPAELAAHRAVYPQVQFVAEHLWRMVGASRLPGYAAPEMALR